jgi:hypothetical protein
VCPTAGVPQRREARIGAESARAEPAEISRFLNLTKRNHVSRIGFVSFPQFLELLFDVSNGIKKYPPSFNRGITGDTLCQNDLPEREMKSRDKRLAIVEPA